MTWIQILALIATLESGGEKNPDAALGDKGAAIGRYQIQAEYLRDANRLGNLNYTLSDMHDPEKAAKIVRTYLSHYASEKRRAALAPTMPRLEFMLRIHNGGPSGWRKSATRSYWLKARKELMK